jgi:CRISPR/Cas system-associated exonuclease Cas4 (RecB family)
LRRVDPYFDINEFVPPPQPPTEDEQKASAMQEKQASNNLQIQQAEIEKNQAETARILADKNLKEFELEKMKSEIEFTSEQIESLDLDDSIKGIMSRLDARLKEVEVEVKHREMGQRDRELDIKEMEATNKATQLAKQANGRSNGK